MIGLSLRTSTIAWLERMGVVKTFDDDPLVLEQDIVDIQQLLGKSDKSEESAEHFSG